MQNYFVYIVRKKTIIKDGQEKRTLDIKQSYQCFLFERIKGGCCMDSNNCIGATTANASPSLAESSTLPKCA